MYKKEKSFPRKCISRGFFFCLFTHATKNISFLQNLLCAHRILKCMRQYFIRNFWHFREKTMVEAFIPVCQSYFSWFPLYIRCLTRVHMVLCYFDIWLVMLGEMMRIVILETNSNSFMPVWKYSFIKLQNTPKMDMSWQFGLTDSFSAATTQGPNHKRTSDKTQNCARSLDKYTSLTRGYILHPVHHMRRTTIPPHTGRAPRWLSGARTTWLTRRRLLRGATAPRRFLPAHSVAVTRFYCLPLPWPWHAVTLTATPPSSIAHRIIPIEYLPASCDCEQQHPMRWSARTRRSLDHGLFCTYSTVRSFSWSIA